MKTFTEKQLENWRAYEAVRSEGDWNMWAPQAIEASGLNKADYLYVMKNFSALKEAVEAVNQANWNTP